MLDEPGRKEFLDPTVILGRLNMDKSTVFVDIGAGTGYFAIPASGMVNTVHALDIQEEMLDILKGKVESGSISNINMVRSEESVFPVPDSSADVVFMANVFHELEDHRAAFKEVMRILKNDGIFAVVDWKKEETPMGPQVGERFSDFDVVEILRLCGFDLVMCHEAGPYHYMITFSKPYME